MPFKEAPTSSPSSRPWRWASCRRCRTRRSRWTSRPLGGPADRAGLQPNDQIVSVNGLSIRSVPALLWYLADQKGKPAVLDVLRDGKHINLTVTPELTDSGDGSGAKAYHLGFQAYDPPARVEQLSFSKSVAASWAYTKKNALLIVDVIKGMFERHISVRQLSGPIGIGQVVHEAAEAPGWMPLIGTISMISINLGMFNLLPFPILDGGMIFCCWWRASSAATCPCLSRSASTRSPSSASCCSRQW